LNFDSNNYNKNLNYIGIANKRFYHINGKTILYIIVRPVFPIILKKNFVNYSKLLCDEQQEKFIGEEENIEKDVYLRSKITLLINKYG
jgi:hypothetical protein